jgi:hypothetical protein
MSERKEYVRRRRRNERDMENMLSVVLLPYTSI